jgi:tetratricopeptide (TPR) repeat protein
MKYFLLISLAVLFANYSCAQSWRDSLAQGKKQYEEGKYDKAYKSLVEAQKIAPEDIDLSKDIGNAAYRNGDYDMAEKAFRSVATNSEKPQESSKHWHNVGNSQLKRKDYQAAIESYKQALRDNPNNENARYNLAEAKRRLKKQQDQQKKQQEKNEQENQNNDQNQNQDQQESKDGQDQKGDEKPGDQQDSQNQSQNSDQKNGSPKSDAEKLSSKKTERMLDDLLKKEMRTKRKAVGTKSSSSEEVESGKKW